MERALAGEDHLGVGAVAPYRGEVVLLLLPLLMLWKILGLGLCFGGGIAVRINVETGLPGTPRHRVLEDHVGRVEALDRLEPETHLAQRDTPAPVDLQHTHEQVVDFFRDGEDGGKEAMRVLEVRLESAVVR